jgi:hypothetical protein
VDNRDGNTLARALCQHLTALHQEHGAALAVDIATAYFNLAGYNLLAGELERTQKVRLLLGAEPRPEAELPQRQPGDPTEPRFTEQQVAAAIAKLEEALRASRDLLPFDLETDSAVRRLLAVLHAGKVEVRRYARHFLHAKAYLARVPEGGIVVGSSNLTFAGLSRNYELNLGHYQEPAVGKVHEWFEELWAAAEPFDLAALYDQLMAEFPPYLIYLRVLLALYGDELADEEQEAGDIPLTNFQQHGVWRALRILKRCGGVLVADGVGLGKTFLAGEILSQYRARRQRVLLICPAALRDSTWKDFLHRFQLFVECCSIRERFQDAMRVDPFNLNPDMLYPIIDATTGKRPAVEPDAAGATARPH